MGLLLKSLSRLDSRPLEPADEPGLPHSAPVQKAAVPTPLTPQTESAAQENFAQAEAALPQIVTAAASNNTSLSPPQPPPPTYIKHFSDLPLATESTVEFGSDWSSTSEFDWQRLEDLQNQVMADLENLTAGDFDITQVNLTQIEPPPPASAVAPTTWPGGIPATVPSAPLSEVAAALPEITSLEITQPFPELAPALLSTPSAPPAPLNLRPEYRELRDQLLAQLDLTKHPTLLITAASQQSVDATWLWPLAAAIIDKLNTTRCTADSQILLAEAADYGFARALGLESCLGLNHILNGRGNWQSAVQATLHPQIKLLCRGKEQLVSPSPQQLKTVWAELSQQFDLLLLATNSINPSQRPTSSNNNLNRSADLLLPLASAAVLYVELGSTSAASAAAAKRLLDAHGIKLLGCVVQPD